MFRNNSFFYVSCCKELLYFYSKYYTHAKMTINLPFLASSHSVLMPYTFKKNIDIRLITSVSPKSSVHNTSSINDMLDYLFDDDLFLKHKLSLKNTLKTDNPTLPSLHLLTNKNVQKNNILKSMSVIRFLKVIEVRKERSASVYKFKRKFFIVTALFIDFSIIFAVY